MPGLNNQPWTELWRAYRNARSKQWQICLAFRSTIFIAVALLAFVGARAMTPRPPTHIFQDLVAGPGGELVVAHTDGVFRSVSGGGMWQRTLAKSGRFVDAGPEGIYLLSLDESGDIFHSRDVGATWTRTGTSAGLRDIVARNGALHGCANRDVRASRDGGRTWSPPATLPSEVGECMRMRAGLDAIYVDAQAGSFFGNRVGSDRWTPIAGTEGSNGIPADVWVSDLHVDAAGILYASTVGKVARSDLDNRHEERVYRSLDRGATWHRFGVTPKYTEHRVVGIRGRTVYLECVDGEALAADVCIWSDQSAMRTLGYVHSRGIIGSVTDSRLIPGADGRLYTVDMYGVHRWESGPAVWRPLESGGIPDPYTGVPSW